MVTGNVLTGWTPYWEKISRDARSSPEKRQWLRRWDIQPERQTSDCGTQLHVQCPPERPMRRESDTEWVWSALCLSSATPVLHTSANTTRTKQIQTRSLNITVQYSIHSTIYSTSFVNVRKTLMIYIQSRFSRFVHIWTNHALKTSLNVKVYMHIFMHLFTRVQNILILTSMRNNNNNLIGLLSSDLIPEELHDWETAHMCPVNEWVSINERRRDFISSCLISCLYSPPCRRPSTYSALRPSRGRICVRWWWDKGYPCTPAAP